MKVVTLSGRSGAGKSTYATLLSRTVESSNVISTSQLMREFMEVESGIVGFQKVHDRSKAAFEECKSEGLMDRVIRAFCPSALYNIVDSVRTIDELNFLRNNCDEVFSVYLKSDASSRYARIAQRSRINDPTKKEEFVQLDKYETELGADHLILESDLVIQNSQSTNLSKYAEYFQEIMR